MNREKGQVNTDNSAKIIVKELLVRDRCKISESAHSAQADSMSALVVLNCLCVSLSLVALSDQLTVFT